MSSRRIGARFSLLFACRNCAAGARPSSVILLAPPSLALGPAPGETLVASPSCEQGRRILGALGGRLGVHAPFFLHSPAPRPPAPRPPRDTLAGGRRDAGTPRRPWTHPAMG